MMHSVIAHPPQVGRSAAEVWRTRRDLNSQPLRSKRSALSS
jgi:hypothetical protein